jgi:pyrroline-5-carboxylate reductase
MFAATSCMAAFFGLLETSSQWLVNNGVPYESARSYLSDLYLGLTKTASLSSDSFLELAARHTTPGGINHQVHERLKAEGVFLSYGHALDQVLERLKS